MYTFYVNVHNLRLERRRDTRCDTRQGDLRVWGRRGGGRLACEWRAVTRRWSTAKRAHASSSIPISGEFLGDARSITRSFDGHGDLRRWTR